MTFISSAVIVAVALSTTPSLSGTDGWPTSVARGTDTTEVVASGESVATPSTDATWTLDTPERRPAAMVPLYATLGALQALDVYSTRRAITMGAYERNPIMRMNGTETGRMLAAKAVATAAAIVFAERAWKKNRKGAVVLMAAINGAMAAVSVHNLRNASRRAR